MAYERPGFSAEPLRTKHRPKADTTASSVQRVLALSKRNDLSGQREDTMERIAQDLAVQEIYLGSQWQLQ
jgi:hypothetical protein